MTSRSCCSMAKTFLLHKKHSPVSGLLVQIDWHHSSASRMDRNCESCSIVLNKNNNTLTITEACWICTPGQVRCWRRRRCRHCFCWQSCPRTTTTSTTTTTVAVGACLFHCKTAKYIGDLTTSIGCGRGYHIITSSSSNQKIANRQNLSCLLPHPIYYM